MFKKLVETTKVLMEKEENPRLHLIIAENIASQLSDEQAASVFNEIGGRRSEKFAAQLREEGNLGGYRTREAFRDSMNQSLGSHIWSKAKGF